MEKQPIQSKSFARYALNQSGALRIPTHVMFDTDDKRSFVEWRKTAPNADLQRYDATLRTALHLIGASDVQSAQKIALGDDETRQKAKDKALVAAGNMYGIHPAERKTKISQYAKEADRVIDYVQQKVVPTLIPQPEMINEVRGAQNPGDLILMLFDDRYAPRARFEAIRKLTLMNIIASIDQKHNGSNTMYVKFLEFLNTHVLDTKTHRIGEHERVYLLSKHNKDTFAVEEVKEISEEQAKNLQLKPYQKLTFIGHRNFFDEKGNLTPVYVTPREKSLEATVLKMLRKDEDNPSAAVDDNIGLFAVFNSKKDLNAFQRHLVDAADTANSGILFTDMDDTLNGEAYHGENTGSSNDIQWRKCFVRVNGATVELAMMTNESYLNYRNKLDASHDEYVVKRAFETGVVDLLLPERFYGTKSKELREQELRRVRRNIEGKVN